MGTAFFEDDGTFNLHSHTNAARYPRRRARSHECTPLQGEGGHQRRSCRSLRAPCGLCLGEPWCTPSHPPPQESPNNIGNKSYSGPNTGSHSNIGPMLSALKRVTNLQQPPPSFSFFSSPSPRGASSGVDDKRLMILEAEFAGALTVMRRHGNILSRVVRDAWDGR